MGEMMRRDGIDKRRLAPTGKTEDYVGGLH
jgi:hypothetical protein